MDVPHPGQEPDPSIISNEFLTPEDIPPETFEYRLGSRSALEWVIDQYQVSTDKRSGITNDPNHPDDRESMVRQIVRWLHSVRALPRP